MQISYWILMVFFVCIGPYCALLAPQWKANHRSTSVQVMNTWLLGYSTTRLESQKRKFARILIITGRKMIISLYANKLGLWIRGSEIFQKWLWLESSHSVKNVTRVESPSFSTWLESSQSHQKSWLESSHWLESRYRLGLD